MRSYAFFSSARQDRAHGQTRPFDPIAAGADPGVGNQTVSMVWRGQIRCGGARLWWVWTRAALSGPDTDPKESASVGRPME